MKLRDQLRAFMASPVVPAYRLEFASAGQQFHGNTFLSGSARIDEAAGTVRGQDDSQGDRGINADDAIRTDLGNF